ncbi:unnamed protein product [Parajaminaea phylloscopi]
MLNKVLKDVINRYHLLDGKKVVYKPGWDTHGLPIESKVSAGLPRSEMQPLFIRGKARALAEAEIKRQMDGFKLFGVMADWDDVYKTFDPEYEYRQLQVFAQMVRKGLVFRANRPVYYSPKSMTALAEAELEYNDNHTARSVYVKFPVTEPGDALLSAIEDPGVLDAVRDGQLQAVIWTTTPWTIPSNMAIAVNPELSYSIVRQGQKDLLLVATDRVAYLASRKMGLAEARTSDTRPTVGPLDTLATFSGKQLLDSRYAHPLQARDRPTSRILPADYVTADSGTGLVHTAPAHGLDDYRLCIDQGVISQPGPSASTSSVMICPINLQGRFTDELEKHYPQLSFLQGELALGVGTPAIVKHLHQEGSLLLEQPIQHRYPYDWRSKTPVMTLATPQWFINVTSLKEKARKALEKVSFIGSPNDRLARIVSSRNEWCISRQRAWGLPLPVLYDAQTGEPLLTPESVEHVASVLREKGTDYWWEGPADEFVLPEYRDREWTKGTDTLDVWFDSGSSWLAAQSRPEQPVADLYLEGTDQHRGWFQSSLLTYLAAAPDGAEPEAPFKTVATHGYALNRRGEKMSKSLGNVISPFFFIEGGPTKADPAWGTDVVRFWVARSGPWGEDVRVSPLTIKHASKNLFQIRNTARFLLANLPATKAETPTLTEAGIQDGITLLDRYILHKLTELDSECRSCYEALDFAGVVRRVTEFASSTLSALYFSVIKDTLYSDSPTSSPRRRAALACCDQVLDTLTSIMAPMTPYLAEEIWHFRNGATEDPPVESDAQEPSFFHQGWRPIANADTWRADHEAAQHAQTLLKVREGLFAMIEQARQDKIGKQSVEFDVDIILPSDDKSLLTDVLQRHEAELSSLFTIAHVRLLPPGSESEGVGSLVRVFGEDKHAYTLVLRLSKQHKCPRCWIYQSDKEASACGRCRQVMLEMGKGPQYVFNQPPSSA